MTRDDDRKPKALPQINAEPCFVCGARLVVRWSDTSLTPIRFMMFVLQSQATTIRSWLRDDTTRAQDDLLQEAVELIERACARLCQFEEDDKAK